MLLSTLKQIGLEEKQAKIYLALLELGETSIKEIAKKSGVKRTSIYDLIDEMIDHGYVKVTIRGKRKRFMAVDPDNLRIVIKKREALLDEILPELRSLNLASGIKPKMLFFEGIKGLKDTYEESLKEKGLTICGWASEDILHVLGEDWANDYVKRRARKKIQSQLIVSKAEKIKRFIKADSLQARKTMVVDPKKYLFSIEINIYGSNVALISARDKIAIIIVSEAIAATMRMIFRMCWNSNRE